MPTPKVSILIPTYNRERYIKQCIESVLTQDFQDWEIICQDNSSTDKTWDILKEYADRDSRIRVFQNEQNLGPIRNWKGCLEKAKGEWIHWLWSDDWIEPNFYTYLLHRIEAENAQMGITPAYLRYENGYSPVNYAHNIQKIQGKLLAKRILLYHDFPYSPVTALLPSKYLKKNFYDKIPIFGKLDPIRSGMGTDSLMIAGTAFDIKTVAYSDKPLVNLRHHAESITISGKFSRRNYNVAHCWFMNQKQIKLQSHEKFKILKRMYKLRQFHLLKTFFFKYML